MGEQGQRQPPDLADQGEFVSAILRPKQTFSFTFSAAGTYTYKDELHPKIRGTIIVKGAPPTLTLASSAKYVVAGDKLTLSGIVSNHKAGEQVSIFYQPYPAAEPDPARGRPDDDRRRVHVRRRARDPHDLPGDLEGRVRDADDGAGAAAADARPQRGWIIHAYGGHGLAGRDVQFQRLNTATGQWVTLKKVHAEQPVGRARRREAPEGPQPAAARDVGEPGRRGAPRRDPPVLNWRQKERR